MAKASPLYTVVEQYSLLDTFLPNSLKHLNLIRYRLLMACSDNGALLSAKNRFLNLIQDTEIRTIFSSLLEVPEIKIQEGVSPLQGIHNKFKSNYGLFDRALRELASVGVPLTTRKLLEDYFYANQDPVYKLSTMASMVMLAFIKDDEINNRK